MSVLTISKINFLNSLFSCAAFPQIAIETPICVNPADFGFDFDENELASELSDSTTCHTSQVLPQIAAEDFESTFHWFIS